MEEGTDTQTIFHRTLPATAGSPIQAYKPVQVALAFGVHSGMLLFPEVAFQASSGK